MGEQIKETETCPACGKTMHRVVTYVFAEDDTKYRGNIGYYCKHCLREYTRFLEPLKERLE